MSVTWEKEEAERELLSALILDLTKSGRLVWKRCWFLSMYRYVTTIGLYTLRFLNDPNYTSHTIYISSKNAQQDAYADGTKVWQLLTGQGERTAPDVGQLIEELKKKG